MSKSLQFIQTFVLCLTLLMSKDVIAGPLCPTPTNLALNKPTSQISTGFSGESARAVDGNTNGVFNNNSVTHTVSGTDDWWQVDLGQVSNIDTIKVFNRTDCCSDRLANFYVFVSQTPFTSTNLTTTLGQSTVKSYLFSGIPTAQTNIPFNIQGRYVRVQLKGTNPLSLAEVQVWGCSTTPILASKVIDLFVLAGQSNAQGFATNAADYPTNAIDSAILLNWTNYGSGGSNGWVKMQPQGLFGPEVTFSRNLKSAGYNPAIFKFIKPGTSLYGNWKAPGQGGIYDAMVVALKQAIIDLQNSGYTVRVRGMVWIQGESDTDTPANAAAYYNNVNMLINDIRKNVLKNACLPIVLGVDDAFPSGNISRIVKGQKTIANYDDYIVFTSMIGLPKADYTHLTSAGVVTQGKVIYDDYKTMVADTSKTPNCPIATTVCSVLTNLALNKTTTQISTGFSAASARAVDGNTSGVFSNNSVTHTSSGTNDWWQVDLGQVVNIDTVNIFNRTDCCTDRLNNFYVFASQTAFTSTDLNTTLGQSTVKAHFYIDTAGIKSNIPLRTKARYVRVQLKGTNPLHLAEVQVMGCTANVVALSNKNTLTIEGQQEGSKAQISWVSENNKATDYFIVEKRNSTTGSFETLETVKNNALQEVAYFRSYDNAPEEGENNYRIKRVSTNGDINFSVVKKLIFSHLETILVSPNPASDQLTITFDKGYTDKAIDITLMNVEGERIIVQHIDKLQSNSHTMDITNQASDGMYMLVIKAKGKRDVFKQVVITH